MSLAPTFVEEVGVNNVLLGGKDNSLDNSTGLSESSEEDSVCVSDTHIVPNSNSSYVMTSPVSSTIDYTATSSWGIFTSLCELLGPIVCSSVIGFSIDIITNSYVGRRLGPTSYAYYMVGVSVLNIFGLSIGMGLVSALDTLVSQAYGRRRQKGSDIGVFCQQAILICVVIMVPIALLLTMGEPLFTLIYGKKLAEGALLVTRHSVPYFFISTIVQVFIKTITAINEPIIPLISYCASVITCVVLNHYFTYSIQSAIYCQTATYTVMLVLLVLFTRFHPRVTFWKECSWPATEELRNVSAMKNFLKVGVPSLISTCSEWWAFEVLYIISASIGIRVVAECSLFSTVAHFMYSISAAMGVATSVKVGNSLGAKDPDLSRQFARISIYTSTCVAVINGIIVWTFSRQIATVFTSDDALSSAFVGLAPLLFCHHILDTTQTTLQGIYRGVNMPGQAAKIVAPALWIIGFSCSVILGILMRLETKGIIVGIFCGYLTEILLMWKGMQGWNWATILKKTV